MERSIISVQKVRDITEKSIRKENMADRNVEGRSDGKQKK